MTYPTDTTRFYHNPKFRFIPEAIIQRATAKFKQQQSQQPKPHKFRVVGTAGNQRVKIAYGNQLSQAG